MNTLTKKQVDSTFKTEILPSIVSQENGMKDKPLRRMTYNNFVDSLQKDGQITRSQANRYCIPSSLLTLLIVLMLSFTGSAQNAKVGKDGNYYAASTAKSTQPAKSTGKTYTDAKGIVYPVQESAKGKLFIIRTSKKTGKEYKQYLKL